MHTPQVRLLEIATGLRWDLQPGSILGRLASAACRLTDPRVSEAHALLSLRGRAFQLLALRGGLRVDEQEEDEIELVAGLEVELAPRVVLRVEEVVLPEQVPALRVADSPPRELVATVYSLVRVPGGGVELLPRFVEPALARVLSTAEGWMVQVEGERPSSWKPGRRWNAGGIELEGALLSLSEIEQSPTLATGVGSSGLTLVARHTTVHILRRGREPVVVDGLPARILSELALMRAPVSWEVVAHELWPGVDVGLDRDRLRRGWDRALRRLRLLLREHGIREDLVRSDRTGNVELFLLPGDRVRDEA